MEIYVELGEKIRFQHSTPQFTPGNVSPPILHGYPSWKALLTQKVD